MKKYEIMVILKPLLPDDIRRSAMEGVEKSITNVKGKVIKTEIWGKRHLAYEIKGHKDGYYVLWGVEMPPEKLNEVNSELKHISELLRHMVLEVEKFDLSEIK